MLKDLATVTLIAGLAFGGVAAFGPKPATRPATHTQIVTFTLPNSPPAPKPIQMIKVLVAEPRRTPPTLRAIARAVSKPHLPADAVAAAPLPPQAVAPQTSADEAGRVATRLASKIPDALSPYFDTFIYVSKASHGPWAQHLFLFHKAADGTLAFEQSFAVSTGRERSEQYFTATPTGLFELDVHRFFPMARSAKWNDARMPWAMFLNYSYREKMAGVALHAAIGAHELAQMGSRASGGCVRLPLAKANLLYHRFLKEEQGQVPVFTFDDARGTTNTAGLTAHDDKGDIVLADGLRVLVVIDNYAGSGASPTQS